MNVLLKSRVLFGREVIYSAETEITRNNLIDVLSETLSIHKTNSEEIDYLYKYYRGKQPILQREKRYALRLTTK